MPNDFVYELVNLLLDRGENMAVAESCTGGRVLARLTEIPGVSAALWGGVVSYSDESKTALLGVEADLVRKYGAVSAEVVRAMACCVQKKSGANWAVAVTGIAGPDGGSAEKPVGMVWIGCCDSNGNNSVQLRRIRGDREEVQRQAADEVLKMLLGMIDNVR